MNTETVRELNPFADIMYFVQSRKFRVMIPEANLWRTNCPTFDTLQEAIEARDRMLKSPHFPRKEYATYVDPNLEMRPYEA